MKRYYLQESEEITLGLNGRCSTVSWVIRDRQSALAHKLDHRSLAVAVVASEKIGEVLVDLLNAPASALSHSITDLEIKGNEYKKFDQE